MPATTAELEDTLEQLHGLECAVRAEFLRVASDIDESGSWRADGARDLAEWLAGKFPISPHHAREIARVAEALSDLPAIAEAYAAGELSWDQLRVLTRYATPDTDEQLAEDAKGLSLRGIEMQARRARRKTASQEAAEMQDTSMKMWRRQGVLHIRGEITGEPSVVIEKAIHRALDRQPTPPEGQPPIPFDRRLANALHEIASGFIAADPDPDRATVVLRTEADILRGERDGVGDLEGLEISSETVRRLCCDARVQEVLEIGGVPIGLGHTRRTVDPTTRRQLIHRDGGCRFPGCERRRWIHAHHIRHWGDRGPTDLGNLVLLCSYHHQFVHEHGWTIRGNPIEHLDFIRADGKTFGAGPPPLRPTTHNQLFNQVA